MPNHTDTSRFLQAVFGDHGSHAIFAHSLTSGGMAHTRSVINSTPGGIATGRSRRFPPEASTNLGGNAIDARALEVRCLVVDDVGTKVAAVAVEMALGAPTAIVETSAGNYQWTYRLSHGVAVDQWGAFFAEVERRVGQKLEGRDAVHLFRLPLGANTKEGRGGFHVRLVEVTTSIFQVGQILSQPSGLPASAGPGPSGDKSLEELRVTMGYIPNTPDIDRDVWIEIGHGLKALCENDADGFTVFDEWSALHDSYDAAKTKAAWDSFGAGGLKSKGGLLLDRAEKSRAFARAVFDDGVEHPEVPPKGDVRFQRGKHKEILATKENAEIGLKGLGIACSYDQFHHRVHVQWKGRDQRLTDDLVLLLRVEMNARYEKDFGSVHIGDAVMTLALLNGFNPVVEMLAEAEKNWDGVARLDRLGPDYFHTEDTLLARECFRKTMLAAVRRARKPGCKFDQILVTESPEGWDKSSAWACLAGEGNFSDADILGKDARAVQEELGDVWIHEIADLSGLGRADIEHVKAFASRTNDRARGAYERYLKDQPRQSIEVGTTNSDAYLLSTTGNRRFWPFKLLSRVDLAALRRDRLQLWGEAARAESAGETLVLDAALWGDAAAAQEERRVVDPWEDELANLPDTLMKEVKEFKDTYQTITNVAINDHLGGHRGAQINGGAGRKIAEIMKRLGWERTYLKDAVGAKVRGYRKRTDSDASVLSSVPKNIF